MFYSKSLLDGTYGQAAGSFAVHRRDLKLIYSLFVIIDMGQSYYPNPVDAANVDRDRARRVGALWNRCKFKFASIVSCLSK